jgi:hypothetical protein
MLAEGVTRFSNIQRMLRTQSISEKGFTPHFKSGCLVSCGSDPGNFQFEKEAINEHVQLMKVVFLEYYKMEGIRFRLIRRGSYPAAFIEDVKSFLQTKNPDTVIDVSKPDKESKYYKGIQYKADILFKGKTYEIVDGGFVDWTQQLLQNRKARMLSTGFGFDLMYRIVHGQL